MVLSALDGSQAYHQSLSFCETALSSNDHALLNYTLYSKYFISQTWSLMLQLQPLILFGVSRVPSPNLSLFQDKPAVVSSVPQREPEPEVQEIDFDDSTVLKYLCRGKSDELPTMAEPEGASSAPDSNSQKTNMDGETPASQGHAKDGGRRTGGGGGSANQNLVGMRLLDPGRPLSASGLPTIYTMRFCGEDGSGGGGGGPPALLAAGGKGGVIALFSTQAHVRSRIVLKKPLARTNSSTIKLLLLMWYFFLMSQKENSNTIHPGNA